MRTHVRLRSYGCCMSGDWREGLENEYSEEESLAPDRLTKRLGVDLPQIATLATMIF